MRTDDFVKVLSKKIGVTQKDTKVIIDGLSAVIKEQLALGEEIPILGVGTFYMKDVAAKDARVGRNPKTGEAVDIPAKPAKQVPAFKVSKTYKVNATI